MEKINSEHLSDHEVDELKFKDVERLKVTQDLIQKLQDVHSVKFSKGMIDDLLRWKRGEL